MEDRKLNILFVSTKNPFPIVDGHGLRTYNLIKQASSKYNIHLLSFLQSEEESKGVAHMKKFCEQVHTVQIPIRKSRMRFFLTGIRSIFSRLPFVVQKYHSREMIDCIKKIINERHIDILHLDLLPLAQYAKYAERIPSVLVDHNVESELMRRRLKTEKLLRKVLFWGEWIKLRSFEMQSLGRVDLTVAVSEIDKSKLKRLFPEARIKVVENGVDTDYYRDEKKEIEENSLVFVGGLNWFPNHDAMVFFYSSILPLIKREIPDIRLRVVGKFEPKDLAYKDEAIDYLGFVKDERDIIAKSSVFVVPLRVGGGTRLKILNALSMEKAVVSTAVGCEGLDVTHERDIIVASDEHNFAESVIDLLKNGNKRKNLGINGRRLVVEQYDWRVLSEKMHRIYQDITVRSEYTKG